MTFTKCIISKNYVPVAFVYEENGIERYEDFGSLCRRNASDGRLTFSESGVFGLYKYGDNDIKICREAEGGGYSDPINPSLTLVQRIVSGGKVVGFVVRDGTGRETKKRIDSILSAAKYLKPDNFTVVEKDGERFLRGTAGTSLMSLPSIDLTPDLMMTPVKPRTIRVEPHDVVDPKLTGGISLVGLFEAVDVCGGSILKFPEDTYKAAGDREADDERFSRLKRCEMAVPVLKANSKKLKANAMNRVPGTVLTSGGPAYAFMFRTKTLAHMYYQDGVLRGDKVRLDRIGIAVPRDNVQRLYKELAGTVAVQPREDVNSTELLIKLGVIDDPVILEANVGEMPILGAEYADSLLGAESIKVILDKISVYNYVAKVMSLSAKLWRSSGVKMPVPPVLKFYSRFSQAELNELKEMGVDITTGLFSGGYSKSSSSGSSKDAPVDVEIVYSLTEDIPAPPSSEAEMSVTEFTSLPEKPKKLIADIVNTKDKVEKVQLAEKAAKRYAKEVEKLQMQLLEHKFAMVLDGNGVVHGHDSSEWNTMEVSSRAKFLKYEHPCGVQVTLRNVEMKR